MSVEKTTRRYRSRKEIDQLLREFRKSGKTKEDFCLECGISRNTLSNWIRSQKHEKKESAGSESDFLALPLSLTTNAIVLAVVMPGGKRVEFYSSPDLEFLKALLQ